MKPLHYLLLLFSLTVLLCCNNNKKPTPNADQSKTIVIPPSDDTTYVTITARTSPGAPTEPPPAEGYTQTFSNDFAESDDINDNQLGLGQFAIKDGRGAFKSIVDPSVNTSNGWRSEQQYTEAEANPVEGAAEWEVNYETVFPSNGHSFQWHPHDGEASACLGLWHDNSSFFIVQKLANDKSVYQPDPLTRIQPNRWYKMRVEYKFSTGTSGYFKWYIDGNLYYQKLNTATSFSSKGQYVKIGQNRWNVSSRSIAYYRNFKIYKKN